MTTSNKTLVAGTIEHAYIELKGDLNNCAERFDEQKGKFLNYNSKEGKYYSFFNKSCLGDHVDVCTTQQFKEYCLQQESVHSSNTQGNSEISSVKPLNDESLYECTKPLKWTLTASQEGVKVQVGMLVKVVTVCPEYQGEGVVLYLGKEQAMVEIDDVEEMVHLECIKPFDDIKTLEDVQREKVLRYLTEDCDIDNCMSVDMYEDLFEMGVFKEER